MQITPRMPSTWHILPSCGAFGLQLPGELALVCLDCPKHDSCLQKKDAKLKKRLLTLCVPTASRGTWATTRLANRIVARPSFHVWP